MHIIYPVFLSLSGHHYVIPSPSLSLSLSLYMNTHTHIRQLVCIPLFSGLFGWNTMSSRGVKQMAKIQILRVMNTDDDANGGGEILEYVTTVSKQKGTAWVAADRLVFLCMVTSISPPDFTQLRLYHLPGHFSSFFCLCSSSLIITGKWVTSLTSY